jgi:outer membrane protein X
MKKLFLVVLAMLMLSAVQAQFKFDMMAGAAIPQGTGAKGGVMFSLEPKYGLPFGMVSGIRVEGALTARGFVANDGSSASANVAGIVSYLVTSDYYPLHYLHIGFQPFVGGGTGVFDMAAASFSGNSSNDVEGTGATSKFGGMARSGFQIHHFRFAVEYNFIGSTTQTITDNNGNKIGTASTKNSYTGIKFGTTIGGGHH